MSPETFKVYDAALRQTTQREVARQQMAERVAADLRAGLDDFAAGRVRDAREVIEELRAKYDL